MEARCNKGRTPLHYLFETRNEADVERFLKIAKEKYNIEFDLDARDNDGLTPRQMTETYEIRRRQFFHKNPHFIDELWVLIKSVLELREKGCVLRNQRAKDVDPARPAA